MSIIISRLIFIDISVEYIVPAVYISTLSVFNSVREGLYSGEADDTPAPNTLIGSVNPKPEPSIFRVFSFHMCLASILRVWTS